MSETTEGAPDTPDIPEEAPVEAEAPVTASRSEIVKEVLAGHWGRGHRRTERLKEAGHDPVKIQKELDKVLKK